MCVFIPLGFDQETIEVSGLSYLFTSVNVGRGFSVLFKSVGYKYNLYSCNYTKREQKNLEEIQNVTAIE